jgi:hypothetical protein
VPDPTVFEGIALAPSAPSDKGATCKRRLDQPIVANILRHWDYRRCASSLAKSNREPPANPRTCPAASWCRKTAVLLLLGWTEVQRLHVRGRHEDLTVSAPLDQKPGEPAVTQQQSSDQRHLSSARWPNSWSLAARAIRNHEQRAVRLPLLADQRPPASSLLVGLRSTLCAPHPGIVGRLGQVAGRCLD